MLKHDIMHQQPSIMLRVVIGLVSHDIMPLRDRMTIKIFPDQSLLKNGARPVCQTHDLQITNWTNIGQLLGFVIVVYRLAYTSDPNYLKNSKSSTSSTAYFRQSILQTLNENNHCLISVLLLLLDQIQV